MSLASLSALAPLVVSSALLVCCASFKDGAAAGSGGTGGTDGGATGPGPDPHDGNGPGPSAHDGGGDDSGGPGALGALPSGYCCTSNEECRGRNCVDFGGGPSVPSGGGKMCADWCWREAGCQGGPLAMRCVGYTDFRKGRCEPAQSAAECIPSERFRPGVKELGACCSPKSDQSDGQECASGLCSLWNEMPRYMCDRVCKGDEDCPGGAYFCGAPDDGFRRCVPNDRKFECRP